MFKKCTNLPKLFLLLVVIFSKQQLFAQIKHTEEYGSITVTHTAPFQPNQYLRFQSRQTEIVVIYYVAADSIWHRQRCTLQKGINNVRLQGEALPSGTYFVRVERMDCHRQVSSLQF